MFYCPFPKVFNGLSYLKDSGKDLQGLITDTIDPVKNGNPN